jgi:ATP-dependent RNA helicase RhlE
MSDAAEKVANKILRNPVRVQVEKESPLKNIDQDIVKYQSNQQKFGILTDLLTKDQFDKVLIFSRTKRGADRLTRDLRQGGFRADAIHGDKSQNKRSRALDSFKNNQLDILVATDVASRGLDIPNVSHVINYDEPENFKTYIHRIGRTGRIGKKGNALTFVN